MHHVSILRLLLFSQKTSPVLCGFVSARSSEHPLEPRADGQVHAGAREATARDC